MSLVNDIPKLIEQWKDLSCHFQYNGCLFDIYEGELLPQVLEDLKKQLSEKSFDTVKHRVAPINLLQKINDKLSKIYVRPPVRSIIDGKKRDQNSLGELLRVSQFDTRMHDANEFFNLFKGVWVEPYLDRGIPRVRPLPADRFFVYSNDSVDPTRPTHLVKVMGLDENKKTVFYGYTAGEFCIFNSDGEVLRPLMAKVGNEDGVNAYGVLPGVYINRSRYNLIPKPDTDTLPLTKLIPVLLSDCNFAIMFQSFSIIYGIDVDDENLKMSPNAFWRFKSDQTKETKPEVGILKPEVDTDKVMNFVKGLIALWLQTRGIRPGAIGDLTSENAASGIAKMIDESDTTEDRKRQISYFAPKDSELLELMVNHMLPVWKSDQLLDLDAAFNGDNYKIATEFPEQHPLVDEKAAAETEALKLETGLTTRKRALKVLNPDLSDEQIDGLLAEIEKEKPLVLGKPPVSPSVPKE
jgi:hypothetical protein